MRPPEATVTETTTTIAGRPTPVVAMTGREFMSILFTGVGVGILVVGLYALLNQFVFSAVLCRPQSAADCSNAPTYAMIVAIVIASIAGIVTLARLRVYRPLIPVLAAAVSLGGAHALVAGTAWYWGLIAAILLFGLAYVTFAWLARVRSFILAIVLTIVLVVVVRLLLAA